jgi:uncharacterized protein (DUF58 family)
MSRFVERLANFLNHDFCPGVNRYVYWLKQPIGWFVLGATAALFIGVSLAPQALVISAAILAVTLIGSAWPWIGIRGASAALSFDRRRATEGSAVRVRITVSNRWPLPLWGLMVERGFFLSANSDEPRPAASLARVAGWSRTTFEWEFSPPRRGRYPTQTPQITTGFPFGLWHARRDIVIENELLVWPRTASLQSVPPIVGESLAVAGTHSRHVGDEGDVVGVRPFRTGDSLRHVHWAQTARQDRFVVCERQATARRRVRLILDPYAGGRQGSHGEALEDLIRLAASIGRQFHAHCADTELCIGQRSVIADPGDRGLKRMMDVLAMWSADEGGDREVSGHGGNGRSLVVVVTIPARVAGWRSILRLQRDAQFVVLDADPHESRLREGDQVPDESSCDRGSCMVVDGRKDALSSLTRRWERFCHDGWSHN